MKGNELFKLAGKNLMIQMNRDRKVSKRTMQRLPKMSKGEYLFGALPFMIKCSLNKKKKSS